MLEPALREIARIRELAQTAQAVLSQNEAATRSACVEPLLRLAGWRTDDPHEVRPEHSIGAVRADYALLAKDKPVALVEAKRLHLVLASADLSQLGNYCYQSGVRWGILTNGLDWVLFDGHNLKVPMDQRVVCRLAVLADHPHVTLQKMLALSSYNLCLEQPVFRIQPPDTAEALPTAPASKAVTTVVKPQPQAAAGGPQRPLPELLAQATPGAKCNVMLILPDGTQEPCNSWSKILRAVITWLAATNHLTQATSPLSDAAGKSRYLVNSQPTHPGGIAFPKGGIQLHNGLWYHTNYDSADCIRNACHALTCLGVAPDTVRWRPAS